VERTSRTILYAARPLSEDMTLDAVTSPYAVSKLAGEATPRCSMSFMIWKRFLCDALTFMVARANQFRGEDTNGSQNARAMNVVKS
jgi:hypothetical protein